MPRRNLIAALTGSAAILVALAIVLGFTVSALAAQRPHDAPAAFLYRPYYGTATVLQRSNSLFDHDSPTLTNDDKFVRYDGYTVTGPSSISGCQPGKTCYDGHNGYDINMFFEPVLAAASGTVIRAGWYNAVNHMDGGGLWVAIDHGNGYVTMYCHLSAVFVTVGQTVTAQSQIGISGSTGSATGPHLHFSVFQMPHWQPMDPFGWQTTKTTDPNPTPDYYLWAGNPEAPTQAPCLGCDNGAAHTGATVVDDTDSGFTTSGAWQTASGAGMIGGGMHWVGTTSGAAPTATAAWQPTIPVSGLYEIGVYIDPANAASQWAPYTVASLDANGQPITTTVWIDQDHVGTFKTVFNNTVSTGPQWVGLGTYYFAAGSSPNGLVTLSNASGEDNVQLGADAVEFVPAAGTLPPAPTPTPVPPTATPTPASIIPPHNRWHP